MTVDTVHQSASRTHCSVVGSRLFRPKLALHCRANVVKVCFLSRWLQFMIAAPSNMGAFNQCSTQLKADRVRTFGTARRDHNCIQPQFLLVVRDFISCID